MDPGGDGAMALLLQLGQSRLKPLVEFVEAFLTALDSGAIGLMPKDRVFGFAGENG